MNERKVWMGLAVLFALGGAVQLPWAPSRFGGIFFLALAVGCAGEWYVLGKRRQCWICAALSVLGRVLFGLVVLSFTVIQIGVIGVHTAANDTASLPAHRYYLVLGARVNPDGQPSAALAARCDTAVAALRTHPESKAVLSGGQGSNEPCTEAQAMFRYITAQGIAPERLLLEQQSTNTIENLRYAKELVYHDLLAQGYGEEYAEKAVDFCIITNDYHLARACRLMQRSTGLTPSGIPAPTPYPGQWVSVRCREYCSILGLMLTGRWW